MLKEQGFEHHDVTAALGVIAGICAGYDDQCFNHSFVETIMEVRGVQIKKDDSCLN